MKKTNVLTVFYSSGIRDISALIRRLTTAFDMVVDIEKGRKVSLPGRAYQASRDQYDAEVLLNVLSKEKTNGLVLWIVHKDIFVSDMNFVFGVARYFADAVVSTYRLPSDEMIAKEAIHEIGHILGLSHCHNNCVMQFSNSLSEAKKKPPFFCDSCKARLAVQPG